MKYTEWKERELEKFKGELPEGLPAKRTIETFTESLEDLTRFIRSVTREKKRAGDIRKLCTMIRHPENYRSRWLVNYFLAGKGEDISPEEAATLVRSYFGSDAIDNARHRPFTADAAKEEYFSHDLWKVGKMSDAEFARIKRSLDREISEYTEEGGIKKISYKKSLEKERPKEKFLTNNLYRWDRVAWEGMTPEEREKYWTRLANGVSAWLRYKDGRVRQVSRAIWNIIDAPDATRDVRGSEK
jgi:hypothetical protein